MPIHVAHAQAAPGTSEKLTIRLDPAALGAMKVEVATAPDGQRDIRIAVEKPETLALLRQDRQHLESALNRAGVATEPARIELDLAAPGSFHDRNEPLRATIAAPTPEGSTGGGMDGGNGGNQPRRHAPEARPPQPLPWAEDQGPARLLRGALDITA